MDGFSGYNQIKMYPNPSELLSESTAVMPFGLKNAGATLIKMMKIFQDIQHSKVECYVDDFKVQSQKKEDHNDDLRRVFEQLRKHKLRMNPLKCFFGLSSGKLFGFVVRKQGIELAKG